MDEFLTTGQMIDALQVGETAISADGTNTNVIRNELGLFLTYQNDVKHSWRVLNINSKVLNTKWKIVRGNFS